MTKPTNRKGSACFLDLLDRNRASFFEALEDAYKTLGTPLSTEVYKNEVLVEFIVKEINHYEEPTRRGTPKGEAVGFSRKKYFAVLLSLTQLPLDVSAHLAGVTYGLLRKWRTELPFNNELTPAAFRFVRQALLPELRRIEKERQSDFDKELASKSFEEIIRGPYLEQKRAPDKRHSANWFWYGEIIRVAITHLINTSLEPPAPLKAAPKVMLSLGDTLLLLKFVSVQTSAAGQTKQPDRAHIKELIDHSLELGMSLLIKPEKDEMLRKHMVHQMRTAREWLKEI